MVVRLLYELIMLFILICRNVADINRKLGNSTNSHARPQPPVQYARFAPTSTEPLSRNEASQVQALAPQAQGQPTQQQLPGQPAEQLPQQPGIFMPAGTECCGFT